MANRRVAGCRLVHLQLVGGFTSHEQLDPPFDDVPPLALLPEQVGPWLQGLGLLGMIATLLLAAASLVVRYRRSDGTVAGS